MSKPLAYLRLLAFAGIGVVSSPSILLAQGKPPVEITAKSMELKKQGVDAFDRRDFQEAVRLYGESYGLSHDPALLYNRARAYQALGKLPEALADLDTFIADASADLKAKASGLDPLRADIASKVSTLTLVTTVRGARVLLGDRVLGTTPLAGVIRVNAGKATLEITADGYFPFTREVTLPGGGVASVTADLVSKQTKGVLVIRSKDDAPSTVTVDGGDVGAAPAEVNVDAGSHKIALRGQDGGEVSSSTVIAAGERKEVTLSINHEPGLLSRWWFWTGVGAVVVGGIVTVVALTTPRKADKGDFGQGQISAPLLRF